MQSQFEILMQNPEFRKEFAVETFIVECTELLSRVMHEKQISKAELAQRVGKSRAWATQLLSGGRNVTARTLAEVAYELGVELRLESSPIAGAQALREWNAMGSMMVTPTARPNKFNVLNFPGPDSKASDTATVEEFDSESADEAVLQGRVA
jgi:transcriptional regulator with XRE-family HTH domain